MCTIKTAAGHVCTSQHPNTHPPPKMQLVQQGSLCPESRPTFEKNTTNASDSKKCVSSPLEKVLEYHKELLQLAEIVQKLDRADAVAI